MTLFSSAAPAAHMQSPSTSSMSRAVSDCGIAQKPAVGASRHDAVQQLLSERESDAQVASGDGLSSELDEGVDFFQVQGERDRAALYDVSAQAVRRRMRMGN